MAIEAFQTVIRYVGDGVQTNFPVPFLFYEKSNVKIQSKYKELYKNLVYPADYEVIQFQSQKGEVRLKLAPAQDEVIAVYLEVPAKQGLALNNNAQISVNALEKQLDRDTVEIMILQEEQKRNIRLPYTDSQTSMEFMQSLFEAKKAALEQADRAELEAQRATNEATKAKNSELEAKTILEQVGIEGEKYVNLAKSEVEKAEDIVKKIPGFAENAQTFFILYVDENFNLQVIQAENEDTLSIGDFETCGTWTILPSRVRFYIHYSGHLLMELPFV